jgi:hypothetical protein
VANRNRRYYDIPFVTLLNQYATLPLPGIQPVLMDEKEMK